MGIFKRNKIEKYEAKGKYFSSHPHITGYNKLSIQFTDERVSVFHKKKSVHEFTWDEISDYEVTDTVTQSNSQRIAATLKDLLHTTTGDILLESQVIGGSPTSLTGSSANLALALHTKNGNNIKRFVTERAKTIKPDVHSTTISSADELAKFAKLRDKGIISEQEFQTKKNQLLSL